MSRMKRTHAPKKASPGDWHPADVVAALRKAGWSLRRLSLANGNHPCVLKHALVTAYPRAQQLIADAIGIAPQAIWPSRYDAHGQPLRGLRSKANKRTAAAAASD